jgi:hypothetical protein
MLEYIMSRPAIFDITVKESFEIFARKFKDAEVCADRAEAIFTVIFAQILQRPLLGFSEEDTVSLIVQNISRGDNDTSFTRDDIKMGLGIIFEFFKENSAPLYKFKTTDGQYFRAIGEISHLIMPRHKILSMLSRLNDKIPRELPQLLDIETPSPSFC